MPEPVDFKIPLPLFANGGNGRIGAGRLLYRADGAVRRNRLLQEKRMHPFILFFIRAVLGVAIATLITRMFRGAVSAAYVAGLAAVLVGLAYGFEYFRKRKSR
jgi:hypothetical protein